MRAAVVDRRPVPTGVDLAPPLSAWTLTGGATYNPATDEITLPSEGALALSPPIRIDQPASVQITWHLWAPGDVPAGPLGDGLMSWIWRPSGTTQGAGFGVGTVARDQWTTRTLTSAAAQAAIWVQVQTVLTAERGIPGTRYRKPTVTITR